MPFFDVYSLFNNVPLDETINIYVKKLFSTSQTTSDLNKQQNFRDAFINYKRKNYFI